MYMYFLILFPLYIYDSNDQAAWTQVQILMICVMITLFISRVNLVFESQGCILNDAAMLESCTCINNNENRHEWHLHTLIIIKNNITYIALLLWKRKKSITLEQRWPE